MALPPLATALGAMLLAALVGLPRPSIGRELPAGGEFGRWETRLRQCRIEARDATGRPLLPPRACLLLRLDQQGAGLLSVRFLGGAEGTGGTGPRMDFAGMLEPGQAGMRCRDGLCAPVGPLRLRVSALAAAGEGSGLPRALLARGECLIARRSVACRADGRDGVDWRAQGRW